MIQVTPHRDSGNEAVRPVLTNRKQECACEVVSLMTLTCTQQRLANLWPTDCYSHVRFWILVENNVHKWVIHGHIMIVCHITSHQLVQLVLGNFNWALQEDPWLLWRNCCCWALGCRGKAIHKAHKAILVQLGTQVPTCQCISQKQCRACVVPLGLHLRTVMDTGMASTRQCHIKTNLKGRQITAEKLSFFYWI